MFSNNVTLKGNELFLVGRAFDSARMGEAGLYLRDTRFLSQFRIRLNGAEPETLSVREGRGRRVTINATNPAIDGLDVPPHTIGVELRAELTNRLESTLSVHNVNRSAVTLKLLIELAADFVDMFEVRGWKGERQGSVRPSRATDNGLVLEFDSVQSNVLSTTVEVAPSPDEVTADAGSGTLGWNFTLQPGESKELGITITPDPADKRPVAGLAETTSPFGFWSNNADLLNLVLQSDSDLDLLQTDFPEGSIPAAGVPWYIAPFGRDSLIVALQTMHVYPDRVANTLRLLAAHQGTKLDAFTEEQPGKILHEMRYGELARSGQIPHTPYYGSIDSTPLFVMTAAQHFLWHRDKRLWRHLQEPIRRALEWIETYGDPDGDGLIEFMGRQSDPTHISQQGWKDSHDSLNHADGSEVEGPIALVEVQGYVYAAYAWLAEAAKLYHDADWSAKLKVKAEKVRAKVEESFWIEGEGFYAQALDGKKQQVQAISSNPGHLLFCGLPMPERAERVIERLLQEDLDSGWGIRTLSSNMPTYNPMSYHNGSVWPHDTSLTMWGMREYGFELPAVQFALELLALSHFAPHNRLAELYCGYSIDDHEDGPVDYPVSCLPQAWAAGAGHLVLRTLLGLKPDFEDRTIVVDPFLPEAFEAVSVAGFAAFGGTYEVAVQAHDDHYHVTADGDVAVAMAGGEHNHDHDHHHQH